MAKERLSGLQREVLGVMGEWQKKDLLLNAINSGDKRTSTMEIFTRCFGGFLETTISPDILLMELCKRDTKRLSSYRGCLFPKNSFRVSYSRTIRNLIQKDFLNGFYSGFRKVNGLEIPIMKAPNDTKLRLIGLAFTEEGLKKWNNSTAPRNKAIVNPINIKEILNEKESN